MRYQRLRTYRPAARSGHPPDFVLLSAIGALALFGLFALASASSMYSFQRYGTPYRVIIHQIINGVIPGLILFAFFSAFNYQRWQRYRWWLFFGTVGILAAVFLPGVGLIRNGARSWMQLGPVSFQPSEVAKLTALIYFSAWFAQTGFQQIRDLQGGLVPFGIAAACIGGLVALQPDLGTLLVIGAIFAVMYFVAGARVAHLAMLGGVAGIGAIAILLSGGHQLERITVFLNPGSDPQGTGYHMTQSYLAIGAGGWFGRGFGKSHQKFAYLPEVSADSIFAIIAEELGFVFAVSLIALLVFIILRALKIARAAPDPFGRFLAVGIATWFGFQSFLNIAVMVGLAPLTGIPLPFISAGGTALASNLAAAGLLINISKQSNN